MEIQIEGKKVKIEHFRGVVTTSRLMGNGYPFVPVIRDDLTCSLCEEKPVEESPALFYFWESTPFCRFCYDKILWLRNLSEEGKVSTFL